MFEGVEVVADYVEVLGVLIFRFRVVLKVWHNDCFGLRGREVLRVGLAEEFQLVTLAGEIDVSVLECLLESVNHEVAVAVEILGQGSAEPFHFEVVGLNGFIVFTGVSDHFLGSLVASQMSLMSTVNSVHIWASTSVVMSPSLPILAIEAADRQMTMVGRLWSCLGQ